MSLTDERPDVGTTDVDRVADGDAIDDLYARIRSTTIGKSIFRSPRRITPRDRAAGHWSNFLLHIYPVKIRRKELHFRYSWYLGVVSMVLLGSLVASGVYLMFFYVPSPASA